MKRITILMLLLLLVCYCNAKARISVDDNVNGFRIVQTERTPHIFPYKETLTDAAISLDLRMRNGVKYYSICIYLFADVTINEGAKLLLKLDDDSIIELNAANQSETTKMMVFTVVQTITITNYLLTQEQLSKILNGKVVKVRLKTANDIIDGNVYGNKFSKTIQEDYKLIEKAIQKNSDDIYDGF